MITNSREEIFDVIEVTNEMPLNRKGGVGSVVENLMSGFKAAGIKALWYLVDHDYRQPELDNILAAYPDVAVGAYDEIGFFQAPILHIHTYRYKDRTWPCKISGQKTVFTVHSLLICEAHSNDVDLTWSIRQQEGLIEAVDEVVLISNSEKRDYDRFGYRQLNANVSVIHNGLKAQPKKNTYRRSGWIGFCGRLVPRKRPEYAQLILLDKGFEGYGTMIAGRGFSRYARDLLRRLKIEDRVRYLGWCGGKRLDAFFAAIDVLAVPSVYEPFGMVALEAAARNIPIVCSRVGGLVELLGEQAFYFDNHTFESFQQAMHRWRRADPDTIKGVTHGALTRVQKYFSDQVMAHKYQRLFNKLRQPAPHTPASLMLLQESSQKQTESISHL